MASIYGWLALFIVCCHRDVIIGLQELIKTERELLVHIMINLRAGYTGFLKSADTAAIGRASVEGTIFGTLDEVRDRNQVVLIHVGLFFTLTFFLPPSCPLSPPLSSNLAFSGPLFLTHFLLIPSIPIPLLPLSSLHISGFPIRFPFPLPFSLNLHLFSTCQ